MNNISPNNLSLSFGDTDVKPIFTQYASAFLKSFLQSTAKLKLPTAESPEVTILLILYNRAELTLLCLRSLFENLLDIPSEIIIIDNNSFDQTKLLLEKVEGARIIQNKENVYYSAAVNQGIELAKSDCVLLLNNDAQLLPGAVRAASETLRGNQNIGAVCGKILLLDGSLQEAGSIIWSDGTCLGYGRGDNPEAPMYVFRRDVDYGSGAFLLLDRNQFLQLKGFDSEAFSPAYYEETDYCVRLWESGKRIVYEPQSVAVHYEFASQKDSTAAIVLQAKKRAIFNERHAGWLEHQRSGPNPTNIIRARSRSGLHKILFIDDQLPNPWRGVGLPRCNSILNALVRFGFSVTFYPAIIEGEETWTSIYSNIPREVEVMYGSEYGRSGLDSFLMSRSGYYDVVLVSRPHNMAALRHIMDNSSSSEKYSLIYDAEAIFANREILYRRLRGLEESPEEAKKKVCEELALAQGANLITSVSEAERQNFLTYGYPNVKTLGHCVPLQVTSETFSSRRDILFVGAIDSQESPNGDGLTWFVDEILPKIADSLGEPIRLYFAGLNLAQEITAKASKSFEILGIVEDLTPLYSSCRLFIAPTRFAAGIPHKVHEAASRGLPTVTTSLIAGQVGWTHNVDLLAADTATDFAANCVRLYTDQGLWQTVRQNAVERVRLECSQERFDSDLMSIIKAVI